MLVHNKLSFIEVPVVSAIKSEDVGVVHWYTNTTQVFVFYGNLKNGLREKGECSKHKRLLAQFIQIVYTVLQNSFNPVYNEKLKYSQFV